MNNIMNLLRINSLKRKVNLFLVNYVFSGVRCFTIKRRLLNNAGFTIGENTKVVGPIICFGKLTIGRYCWIGKNFLVNRNGKVIIGDNCDIAPEVTFQTGGHKIGDAERRAGGGVSFSQKVGNGTWIGGRVTILNDVQIGNSCVIAGCACVTQDVADNLLVGGVPARMIREIDDDKEN